MLEPQSLEEAFAGFAQSFRVALAYVPYDDEDERAQAAKEGDAALRTLALVVLEEAIGTVNEEVDMFGDLRARIAALGERDGD